MLMLLASCAEVFSIGAIFPFLGALTSPDLFFHHRLARPLVDFLSLKEPKGLLLPMTVVFGLAAILAGSVRLLLLWSSSRVSVKVATELSNDLYRRTLYQAYKVHISRNSSEIIDSISTKVNAVIGMIVMILNLFSSVIMLTAIVIALAYVHPFAAFTVFGGFALIYIFIVKLTRNRLLKVSESMARESTKVIKLLQEGLGSIRDMLIYGTQTVYCDIYRKADLSLRRAQGDNQVITQAPRFLMEGLGMLLIAILTYILGQSTENFSLIIPTLGALALGAQRLLPVLQQGYASWSGIRGGQVSLQDTLDLLAQPLPYHVSKPPAQMIPFHNDIRLDDMSFRYLPNSPWVIHHLNATIPRGYRVGFIGSTGSGKSTLLDLVMGLLEPNQGCLKIDGVEINSHNYRSWQAHIAHVPQSIFLADSTIEENIAFGVPPEKLDHERVKQAAKDAQIAEYIESLPNRYKAIVGERGINLSGGQRQRIGIARALYRKADVLVFDEATSALDHQTEKAVMGAIEALNPDLTIMIIAHRLTTLERCNLIIELDGGNVRRIGSYKEIIEKSH